MKGDFFMKEQNKLLAWVKVHKKELIITGVSSTAIIAIIFCYRNKKYLTTLWTTLQATIAKIPESEPVVAEEIIEAPETIVVVIEPMKLIVVDSSNIDQISFGVSKHIRNLPKGWKPSSVKVETAAEKGIHLLQNQTWVADYMKGGAVA